MKFLFLLRFMNFEDCFWFSSMKFFSKRIQIIFVLLIFRNFRFLPKFCFVINEARFEKY
jgi:hypothetical protein